MARNTRRWLPILLAGCTLPGQSTWASAITEDPSEGWIGPFQFVVTSEGVSLQVDQGLLKNENNLLPDRPDTYSWSSQDPVRLADGSVIGPVEVTIQGDPYINLNFTVTAGGADTTFTISSAAIPVGFNGSAVNTSASVTLTDNHYPANGATLTGLMPGNKTFEALYNTTSVYADLAKGITISGGGQVSSENATDQYLGSVLNMQSVWKFKVTAGDSVSGTSHYQIVPTPDGGSGLALLVTSGLFLLGGGLVPRRRN